MNTQNYPNWIVPLYISKELKEIGFDEPTLFHYYENDFDVTIETNSYYDEGEAQGYLHFYISAFKKENFNRDKKCISLPVWEQVFAWFKKHCYHVNIDDKGTWIHWSFYNEMIEPPILEDEPQDGWETDYYEALEALVVALIKTYKSEQK